MSDATHRPVSDAVVTGRRASGCRRCSRARATARAGCATTSSREGRVTVNGEVAQPGRRVDPDVDRIAVDGVPVAARDDLVYYLLNKPAGYVSTASDPEGRPRSSSSCRTSRASSRSGASTTRPKACSCSPTTVTSRSCSRIRATASPRPTSPRSKACRRRASSARLRTGVELDDGMTAPATAALVQEHGSGAAIELTIHEGRNRQVRRMCDAVGHPVRRLVRTRIGPLADRKLPPGEWRPLTDGARSERLVTKRRRRSASTSRSQASTTRRSGADPANLARREIAGAARRDHVRRGLQGRDRHQGVTHGQGALRPQRSRQRRRRQHDLHRHPRPHRPVPGHVGAAALGSRRHPAARRPGAGGAARHAPLRAGPGALLHRPAPRRAEHVFLEGAAALRQDLAEPGGRR